MLITLNKLKNEVLEPVSFYMKKFDSRFTMSRHVHPYIEFMYCQSGQFIFEVYAEDEKGNKAFQVYKISAGVFIILDAMTPHRIVTESEAMIYNVEFEVKTKTEYNPFGVFDVLSVNYSGIMGRGGWMQIANAQNGYGIMADTENVEYCMRTFIEAMFEGNDSFEQALIAQSKLNVLLAEIGKCKTVGKPNGSLWYVRRVQEYINRNYASDIKIDDIADFANISKAYLQRIFRESTGSTILKTVNTVRINKAKQLLLETNFSISQIVSRAGFRNSQHFIYEFKSATGITPSEYRKQSQRHIINHQMLDHDSGPFLEKLPR